MQAAIRSHDYLCTIKKKHIKDGTVISQDPRSVMTMTILQVIVKGTRTGRQRKRLEDNMKDWTGLGVCLANLSEQLKIE